MASTDPRIKQSTEVLLTQEGFVRRQTFDTLMGSEEDFLKKLLAQSNELLINPMPLPGLCPQSDKTYVANYSGKKNSFIFARITGFPFPQAVFSQRVSYPGQFTATDDTQIKNHYQFLPNVITTEYSLRSSLASAEELSMQEWMRQQQESGDYIFDTPEKPILWSHPNYEIWIVLHQGSETGYGGLGTGGGVIFLRDKESGTPYIPALPNIYEDGRICFGGSAAYYDAQGSTSMAHLRHTLRGFFESPPNSDLYNRDPMQAYVGFDRTGEPLVPQDHGAFKRSFLSAHSNSSVIAFCKALQNDNLQTE